MKTGIETAINLSNNLGEQSSQIKWTVITGCFQKPGRNGPILAVVFQISQSETELGKFI